MRTITISTDSTLNQRISTISKCISVTLEHSTELQPTINQLVNTYGRIINPSSKEKTLLIRMTELSIVDVIDKLVPFGYTVCEELQEFYNTIKSWTIDECRDLNKFENFPETVQQLIYDDIGPNYSDLLFNDRRVRYQYTDKKQLDESLSSIIANRDTPKVWVDKNRYSILDTINSIIELNRLPLLIVFSEKTPLNTIADFNDVISALNKNNVTTNTNVYFRLDNDENGKIFNLAVANGKHNGILDESTNVAMIHGNKLPKFFLHSGWQPKSVLCLDNVLRHSKIAVYANCCDLIISYTNTEPTIGIKRAWE